MCILTRRKEKEKTEVPEVEPLDFASEKSNDITEIMFHLYLLHTTGTLCEVK
jgi:hypothetical protein